jgi:hypothetical protein
LRDAFEHVGGVAFGFDEGPDFFDLAGFTDEKRAANNAYEGAAHELLFLPGAEFRDDLVGGIGEQGKIDLVLGLERGLGFDGIGTHAEYGHTMLVEVFFCVTKLGRFNGSTGSVGFGIEKEENALTFEICQGDERVVVGFEAKGGGFCAEF